LIDLFNEGKYTNLLPCDGTVIYYGKVLSRSESDYYMESLSINVAWKHDEAVIYGKRYVTDRKVAWYGDEEFSYTYSGVTKHALPWTQDLLRLKEKAEEITQASYNSCLLNLYHHGRETMAWHSDGENWLHRLPPTTKITRPRINLTFRTIMPSTRGIISTAKRFK
jgi:alkylated DNA repair dioxygenase AlkB